jgi:hypothetical protein
VIVAAPEFKTYFQSFRTDEAGQVFMTGILNVEAFSKVNVAIVQASEAPVSIAAVCSMGKLSGETLAQPVAKFW